MDEINIKVYDELMREPEIRELVINEGSFFNVGMLEFYYFDEDLLKTERLKAIHKVFKSEFLNGWKQKDRSFFENVLST